MKKSILLVFFACGFVAGLLFSQAYSNINYINPMREQIESLKSKNIGFAHNDSILIQNDSIAAQHISILFENYAALMNEQAE